MNWLISASIRLNVMLVLAISVSALVRGEEPNNLLRRVKIAESVFDERFSVDRVERVLSQRYEPELSSLVKKGGSETVARIRAILSSFAQEVAASRSFKQDYSVWLADQLDETELWRYYDFVRSTFGKKILGLDDRVQPMLSETINRLNKGKTNSIRILLTEAKVKEIP